jgi:hypothetical protein
MLHQEIGHQIQIVNKTLTRKERGQAIRLMLITQVIVIFLRNQESHLLYIQVKIRKFLIT